MSLPTLVALTQDNGEWQRFLADWQAQCQHFNEDFESYASGALQVLDDLARSPEPNAGVFALERDGRFDAVCQANVAGIPGYDSPVLRIRMLVVAPAFDFGDVTVDEYADVLVQLFGGVINLTFAQLPARHVKFHLRSPADRTFFAAFGSHLGSSTAFASVQVRGGWLYVTKR